MRYQDKRVYLYCFAHAAELTMEAIKETINSIMFTWGTKKNSANFYNFENLLNKLLTKKEFGHIKFNNFKKGIIDIKVDSSNWLYYFNLKKKELIVSVRQDIESVKDIRFHLGETK